MRPKRSGLAVEVILTILTVQQKKKEKERTTCFYFLLFKAWFTKIQNDGLHHIRDTIHSQAYRIYHKQERFKIIIITSKWVLTKQYICFLYILYKYASVFAQEGVSLEIYTENKKEM